MSHREAPRPPRASPERRFRRIALAAATLVGLSLIAVVPAQASDDGARSDSPGLVLEGAPLIHSFDTTTPGDTVETTWRLTTDRRADFSYEGTFVTAGDVSAPLSEALAIEYGVVDADGAATRWLAAGTLANPTPYSTVTGISRMTGPGSATIPVRVTLVDTSELPPGKTQTVTASFEVAHLAASGGDSPRDGTGLAASGAPSAFWVLPSLLAGLLIIAGLLLRRRERSRSLSPRAGHAHTQAGT